MADQQNGIQSTSSLAATGMQSFDRPGGIGLSDDDERFLRDVDVHAKSPAKPMRLRELAVMCMIFNRMIGTGIFRTPATVFQYTESVGVSMLWWALGAIVAICGILVYMELGLTLPLYRIGDTDISVTDISVPRSGGELNYLKYILKKPVYFAICVFGITFILLANVATNSIAFGLSILDAADLSGINNHDEIVRGIAIGMAAFSCLIHGFWRQGGLYLNNLLALIKILILLMIFILGMIAVSGKVFPKPAGAPAALYDSSLASSFNGKNADAYGYAEAFLSILFAFGGFNQANYVMGEVDDPRRRYKWPAFFAVVIVSTLYLLVNIAYFVVVPAEDFNETAITSNVAHKFFDLTLGSLSSSWAPKASRILSGFMAISSFGNIIVMTYTAARVKQEIAKEGILPFRRMLANSKRSIVIPVRKLWKSKYETLPEEVPVGALILHFTMSILLILGTWPLTTPDTYSLLVDLYSYSIDATFGVCVGFGLLFLRLLPKRGWAEHSQNSGFRINPYVSFFAAAIFGIANLFPIVAKWIPPKVAVASAVPWYTTGVVGWSILLCGFFWWVGFRFFVPHIGRDHVGRYLLVTRKLWFHQENDYKVLEYEDIDFRWPPRSKEKETTLQEEVIVAKDSEVRARLQRDETRGRYL